VDKGSRSGVDGALVGRDFPEHTADIDGVSRVSRVDIGICVCTARRSIAINDVGLSRESGLSLGVSVLNSGQTSRSKPSLEYSASTSGLDRVEGSGGNGHSVSASSLNVTGLGSGA